LNRIPIAGTRNRNASSSLALVCNGFSRFLLILAAIELVTWPLTQHFWNWDHLLHGGQDFESSLLFAVMSLCLVLLLAQHSKHHMDHLLTIRRLFRFISHDRGPDSTILDRNSPILHSEPIKSRSLSMSSLPLQI
jgi:hypothetical protein